MKLNPFTRRATASLLIALAAATAQNVSAQSDNFDSGTLDPGWRQSNFNQGLIQLSFPTVGNGKGLRIQANPVPSPAINGVELLYRDNNYTDFYLAVDIVDWGGVERDQASVLIARATIGAHPGEASGVICNYDSSQYLDTANPATSRRQGQFQINLVTPGFSTRTLAATEITLEPGRPYRMVFKGVGTRYTASVYDHYDFTKPLVTIAADDAGEFTSGKVGFLSFHRDTPQNPFPNYATDVTIDNFVAAATDPNPATAPALAHPVPGTPTIDTRIPAERFKNFFDPTSDIQFTANTFAADTIHVPGTKLRLNGTDVSDRLVITSNGPRLIARLQAGVLVPNTVYSAAIEVEDTTGSKKSTNTFWFDTFSEAYLKSGSAKAIEAEDFNFDGGQHLAEPIPVSGYDKDGVQVNGNGVGYLELGGIEGIDFHDARLTPESPWGGEYRSATPVGLSAGMYPEVIDLNEPDGSPVRRSDNVRSQYAVSNLLEHVVHRTEVGEWLNYTRNFAPGTYKAYLRVASFGTTVVELHQVTGDPTQPDAATTKVGRFNVPNQLTRYNYRYIPLTTDAGAPATVTIGAGAQTLRLLMAGTAGQDNRKLAINYLLLVREPIPGGGPTVLDTFADGNDTAAPAWVRFDPIGGLTAAPAQFTFPSGAYRIVSPAPAAPDAGPARAGSFLKDFQYSDFYVAVDVIDFDDTVRQAFGIAARIVTPGLGTTGGYLFSWEPGSGALPGTTNGDLDISRIVNEAPEDQIETAPSGLHLTRGKSYRFVFMGKGFDFEGQVYELPDTVNPIFRLPAHDDTEMFAVGTVGVIVADQGSGELNKGDATFDNFLATTDEPRLGFSKVGDSVTITWPNIPFRLQATQSLTTPQWLDITTGISLVGELNTFTVPASGPSAFFRLIYP